MPEVLDRKEGNRRPRNHVLVVTEGTTEKQYFSGLKERGCNVAILVPGSSVTDAENIVRYCVKQMDHYEIDPNDGDLAICVFDFDNNTHQNLRRAAEIAHGHQIILAVSNPCFELWMAMHFTNVDRCLTAKELSSLVGRYIRGYSKSGNYNGILSPLRDKALQRADRLWGLINLKDDSITEIPNPGTNVHIAVQSIAKLKSMNKADRCRGKR